jgi:hypothetical protein
MKSATMRQPGRRAYERAELWAEERDPTHAPAVHRHDRHHRRFPSSAISFKEALAKVWAMIAGEE